ncbi:MAG: HNH endonuclease [Flavobacteriaceae bacterium]|nr:HNH endonuclease [Flavobacteriaceae bacterium]
MKYFRNEVWQPFSQTTWDDNERIFVSDYGRVKKEQPNGEFKLMKFYKASGYDMFWYRKKTGKTSTLYVHRVVAALFLNNENNHKYVMHLDHDKTNNRADNLKWGNRKDVVEHNLTNPRVIKGKLNKRMSYKLCEAKVKIIKRKLFDPNRKTRYKMIAKQFGVSEMQLHRIKTGENWGHVTDY